MLGQTTGIEIAAEDKENVDAKTAVTRAQNGDERLAHAHQRMLMGPEHQARGDEPNQIEGVGMLTQRHHAPHFIRSRGGAPRRNAASSRFSPRSGPPASQRSRRTAQDKLDVIARDADIVQFAIGKLCQFAALPGSLGHGQAVAGRAVAPTMRPGGRGAAEPATEHVRTAAQPAGSKQASAVSRLSGQHCRDRFE